MLTPVNLVIKKNAKNLSFNKNNVSTYSLPTELFNLPAVPSTASWSSNTLATWCEELTHLKKPWCWERLKPGEEGDNRGWDGWMASPTWWTWAWVSSRSWWWTGKPGMLLSMGLQGVRQDWETELNWDSTFRDLHSVDLGWYQISFKTFQDNFYRRLESSH